MQTNIEIDDSLMAEALQATGLRTKREAVELGLRTLLLLSSKPKFEASRANSTGPETWTP